MVPPPPEYTPSPVLPWRAALAPAAGPPVHPLLAISEPPPRAVERPPSRLAGVRRMLAVASSGVVAGGGPVGPEPGLHRRLPKLVLILGARGGAGATTLAFDLAWRASSSAEPGVLLVDGDEEQPSLDLLLGASTVEEDLWPSARLDHVLLRLPELASGAVALDRLLWRSPADGLQALLGAASPRGAAAAGVEHLDYLYRYQLSPGFGSIVVDGGSMGRELSRSARFYTSIADWVLVVSRGGDQDVRSCRRLLEEVLAAPGRRRLGVVLSSDRAVGPGTAWRQLERTGTACWSRPWVPRSAQLAARRHRPLAELDRQVLAALAPVMAATAASESSRE